MGVDARIRKVQSETLDWIIGHFPGVGLDRRAEDFVSIFREVIPLGAKILDIGGGWGFYAEPLKRHLNCQVTILDVRKPGFSKAPVTIYEGDRMPFPDQSFDVSMLITVLHHVASPEKVLAEAKRVTRHLVLVVEDLYQSAIGRYWAILRDSIYNLEFVGHPRNFRRKEEWLTCFRKLGFRLEFEREISTSLLGIPIQNGCFALGC